MKKNMTYSQAILAYLKTNDRIIPAHQCNSNVSIGRKQHWFGSELGRVCRKMSPPNFRFMRDIRKYPLLRGWIEKEDRYGRMRSYRTFFINPKFKN